MRSTRTHHALWLVLSCLVLAASASAAAAQDKPNVILILTDDQGYGDLGCYGSTRIKTPRIDRMAVEGVRFTDFYAPDAYRSSDHDPIKVGVSAELAPIEIEILTVNDFHGRIEAASGIPGAAQMGGMPLELARHHAVHLAHLIEGGMRDEGANIAAQEQSDAELFATTDDVGIEPTVLEVRVRVDARHEATSASALRTRRSVSSMSSAVCAALT